MRLLYYGNRLLHLICNLDKYGCLFSFCSHLSLPSSQCTVVDGSLLKVQDHWSEVCKRLVRSYFQWYFNNFYEFHCIVWKLFEQVWHWGSNLKQCRIVMMQGLIYATFSLWRLLFRSSHFSFFLMNNKHTQTLSNDIKICMYLIFCWKSFNLDRQLLRQKFVKYFQK